MQRSDGGLSSTSFLCDVQVSREQGDSHRPGLLYDRCCASAGAMGCFGTQIWIRRSSGVVLDSFEAVSPQLAVARVRFRGMALSLCHLSTCATRISHE